MCVLAFFEGVCECVNQVKSCPGSLQYMTLSDISWDKPSIDYAQQYSVGESMVLTAGRSVAGKG